jgi:hypothetical protein
MIYPGSIGAHTLRNASDWRREGTGEGWGKSLRRPCREIKVAVVTRMLGRGATEAMAQRGWYRPFAEGPRYEVVRMLRARGLVPVSRPARIGPNYMVQATDRKGDLKLVVVDAAYGDFVRVISLNRPPLPPAKPVWARPPRPLDDDDVATLAPAAIPAPPRTALVTPLPRPRPALAAPSPVAPKPDASEQPMSSPDAPAAEAPNAVEPPPVTAAAPAPRVGRAAGERRGVP